MKNFKRQIIRYLSIPFTGIAESVFSAFRPCPVPVRAPVKNDRRNQGGYMLLVLFLLALGISAVFASVSFYYARVNDINRYFAFGQQVARYARGVHYYTQDTAVKPTISDVMPSSITPAAIASSGAISGGFALSRLNSVTVTQIPRAIFAPRNMPSGVRAASAYIYFDLTPVSAGNPPTQVQLDAIKAGAASEGTLIGFPPDPRVFNIFGTTKSISVPVVNRKACARNVAGVQTVEAGNANAAFVTWGDGLYDCMNVADINTLFAGVGLPAANMDYYDFIVPAWVSAQSKLDRRAVFRDIQPGIPEGQTMETALLMDGNDITNIGNLTNNALQIRNDYNVAGDIAVGGNVTITGQMHTDGNFESSGTGSVTGDLSVGGNLDVVQTRTAAAAAGGIPLRVGIRATGITKIDAGTIGGTGTNFTAASPTTPAGRAAYGGTVTVNKETTTPANSRVTLGATTLLRVEGTPTIATSTITVNGLGAAVPYTTGNFMAGAVNSGIVAGVTNVNTDVGTAAVISLPGGNVDVSNNLDITRTDTPASPGSLNVDGEINGVNTVRASGNCYGTCPDTAPPPDPDPLE